jgi:glycosidase
MGRLVLVAKHVNVWLYQLSQRYGRAIETLDQIPDEILEELNAQGFNGLWLVGLWQRSPASQRIKHQFGNPSAEASAYAVYRYEAGERFGGEKALGDLKRRAAKAGLRLGVDMVPNHSGLDAPWIAEHPQRYLAVPDNPLPDNYAFTGPNLSADPRFELRLEDHYADQSDAAVVFQRTDTRSGHTDYVYHGNDGVGVPWNDTAQLDFLKPETRQAVIDQIVDVARRFPIVRFDAAMTLVKRHIQRLWYPKRGQPGFIYTRQDYRLSNQEFNRRLPREFWAEAVERLRAEAPESLLLAEAFWLLEGVFVHQLGLHRAYNSGFMHNLRAEDNVAFKQAIQEALVFDPRLLAQYVNFLSSPDEPSTAEAFGRGDKYFAAATLLASLPGTPLFDHGQVEGYEETYAMDLAKPYRKEQPDAALVARHQQEIAPLLSQREHFAGVERFRLYEVRSPRGKSIEDIIAFSNCQGEQRALVLVNNSSQSQSGDLLNSAAYVRVPTGKHYTESLVEALDLSAGSWRARGSQAGTPDLILPSPVNKPISVKLAPYEARVYLDFEAV